MPYPLLVIAIGREAAEACRGLASASAASAAASSAAASARVVCWVPDTASQAEGLGVGTRDLRGQWGKGLSGNQSYNRFHLLSAL